MLLRNAVGQAFSPAQLDGCDEISRANDAGRSSILRPIEFFNNLLKDVPAQIVIFDDVRQSVADVGGVNLHVLFL